MPRVQYCPPSSNRKVADGRVDAVAGLTSRAGGQLSKQRLRPLATTLVALTVFVAPVVSGAQPPELRVVARTQASGNVEVLDLVEGGVARTGDGLRFRVRSSTRAYVYVFAVGASGSAVLLHPIERGSGDALTQSGNTINIPEGDAFLDLDRHVGREYVVTVGARSPVRDIDSMLLAAEEAVADRGRLEARALADYGDARVFRFDHIASVRGTQPRTPIIAAEPQQQPKSVSLFAQQPNDQGVLSGSGSRIQALLKGRKPERLAVPVARVVDAPAAEGTPSQVATERQANRVRRGTSLDLRGISGTAGVPGDTAQRAPTDESVETTTAAQRPAAIVAEEAASAKGASTLGTSTSTASTWNNLFGDSSDTKPAGGPVRTTEPDATRPIKEATTQEDAGASPWTKLTGLFTGPAEATSPTKSKPPGSDKASEQQPEAPSGPALATVPRSGDKLARLFDDAGRASSISGESSRPRSSTGANADTSLLRLFDAAPATDSTRQSPQPKTAPPQTNSFDRLFDTKSKTLASSDPERTKPAVPSSDPQPEQTLLSRLFGGDEEPQKTAPTFIEARAKEAPAPPRARIKVTTLAVSEPGSESESGPPREASFFERLTGGSDPKNKAEEEKAPPLPRESSPGLFSRLFGDDDAKAPPGQSRALAFEAGPSVPTGDTQRQTTATVHRPEAVVVEERVVTAPQLAFEAGPSVPTGDTQRQTTATVPAVVAVPQPVDSPTPGRPAVPEAAVADTSTDTTEEAPGFFARLFRSNPQAQPEDSGASARAQSETPQSQAATSGPVTEVVVVAERSPVSEPPAAPTVMQQDKPGLLSGIKGWFGLNEPEKAPEIPSPANTSSTVAQAPVAPSASAPRIIQNEVDGSVSLPQIGGQPGATAVVESRRNTDPEPDTNSSVLGATGSRISSLLGLAPAAAPPVDVAVVDGASNAQTSDSSNPVSPASAQATEFRTDAAPEPPVGQAIEPAPTISLARQSAPPSGETVALQSEPSPQPQVPTFDVKPVARPAVVNAAPKLAGGENETVTTGDVAKPDTVTADVRTQSVVVEAGRPRLEPLALSSQQARAELDPFGDGNTMRSVVLVVSPAARGSGVVVDTQGLILTNWQVVRRFRRVTVWLKEAGSAGVDSTAARSAIVIRTNRTSDLALLQLEGDSPVNVPPIAMALRAAHSRGEPVHLVSHAGNAQWQHTPGQYESAKATHSWLSNGKHVHKAAVVRARLETRPELTGGPLLNDSLQMVGLSSQVSKRTSHVYAVSVEGVRRFLAGQSAPDPGG